MSQKEKRERIIEVAVGVFLFTALFVWGFVQPITNQPDERCRYVIPYYIMMNGKLPNGTLRELVLSSYGISYAYFPGLSYIVMAVFMKIASVFTSSSFAILMAARTVNMLAGVVSYVFARKIAKKLFQNEWTGWLFTLTVAFWPQVLFIFTYVNCDAFAYMSCAIMVYALVSGLKEGWNRKYVLTLSAGIAICALSYYNAYGMILGCVFVFVFSFFYKKENGKYGFHIKECARIGFSIVGIVFVLAGWWFIRNAVLYEGDFLGFAANSRSAEQYAIDIYKPSMRVTLQNSGNPVWCLIVNEEFRFLLKQSFFARWGNMDVLAPNYIIRGFKIILFVGILGLLLPNRNKVFTGAKRAGFAIGMFVSAFTAFFLTYWYSYTSDYQPQGRYLLPGLIPMLCITFMGIQNITQLICKLKVRGICLGVYGIRSVYVGSYIYIAISTIGSIYIIWRQYYEKLSETVNMIFTGGPI